MKQRQAANAKDDPIGLCRPGGLFCYHVSAAAESRAAPEPDFGHLRIEVTVDDPKAYARPWTLTLNRDLAVDTELLDSHCTDNEKSRLAER